MTTRNLLGIIAISAGLAALAHAQSSAQPQVAKDDPSGSNQVLGPCVPGSTPNLLIPLDGTFSVVTFNGVGCSGPASGGDPCQRNDDDVTGAVALAGGWLFSLYNNPPTNTVFINNNGNVTLGVDFCTFTPVGFPDAAIPPCVAPFWGDVDTRNAASGVVYVRNNPGQLVVIWDRVGYYNTHANLLNTFELILTDGNDPIIGLGNNVAFCYGDMAWTTGDASGGSGGFGGTPATVGANAGDGTNFFQIGRFDAPGTCYDGPGGASDCVSFLDRTCYAFNVGGSTNNVAPVYLNPPGNCLTATVGQTLNFTIQAIGPEAIQTVTLTNNGGSLANFSSVDTPGNPASSACTFTPDCSQVGQQTVIFTATDNFNPPLSSQLTVCIDVNLDIVEYCFGDGPGNGGPDCPCANSVPANPNGCLHSLGVGAHLAGTGCPSISGDLLQITATNLVPNKPTFFFAATAQNNGGLGSPFGDGLTCLAGQRKRVGKLFHAPANGTATVPLPSEAALSVQFPPSVGQTHNYQVFFRNQGGPCGTGFNTSNGVSVVWQP